jgi:hypothetical protein
VQASGEQRPGSVEGAVAEIKAAANRVGATLSEHAVVLARAQAALSQLDTKLELARQKGALKFFNAEYRRRREEAKARGAGFMNYELQRRLGPPSQAPRGGCCRELDRGSG